jgi:hypothetical protein
MPGSGVILVLDGDQEGVMVHRPGGLSRVGFGEADVAPEVEPTIASYFDAFSPTPAWEDLPSWPADVFCLCNLVLDSTEAYRFAVAPSGNHRWPPSPHWNDEVVEAAARWRTLCGSGSWRATEGAGIEALPERLRRDWELLTRHRDLPLSKIRSGEAWTVCEALLSLHALADEACSGLAAPGAPAEDSMEWLAWHLLTRRGTLSRLSPARVRIVPKTNFATRGITIRSMSRYLALFYESVDVRWRRVESEVQALTAADGPRTYNVLLLPWPLEVRSTDFHPAPSPLENMDSNIFGFFEFSPAQTLRHEYVDELLAAASREVGHVDAVILPEAAVRPYEVEVLEKAMEVAGSSFLIAGVREPPSENMFGRNYLHFGVRTDAGWQRYQQDKHHRWSLDESQIRQYHLAHALDPRKLWWEAIDIRSRSLHVIDVGGGATTAPLVCEDLARMDEVADLLRRIGPSVIVAVLLDGPQLTSRWPCRYACVLAEEPGSAVLTLTSFGMVARSRPPGMHTSRVVALWSDCVQGVREISLAPRGGCGADHGQCRDEDGVDRRRSAAHVRAEPVARQRATAARPGATPSGVDDVTSAIAPLRPPATGCSWRLLIRATS